MTNPNDATPPASGHEGDDWENRAWLNAMSRVGFVRYADDPESYASSMPSDGGEGPEGWVIFDDVLSREELANEQKITEWWDREVADRLDGTVLEISIRIPAEQADLFGPGDLSGPLRYAILNGLVTTRLRGGDPLEHQ